MFQKRLKLAVNVGSSSKDLESDGCLKASALKVPFAYMYISIHMRKNVCCRPAVHVHKYVLVVCLEAG